MNQPSPNKKLTAESGKRTRRAFEETPNVDPQDQSALPTETSPPSPPPPEATAPNTGLKELPPVNMTHLTLEKVMALKDGSENFVALVLVNKKPKVNLKKKIRPVRRGQEGLVCIDAGIGVQVKGTGGVDFLLIRRSYLSYGMHPCKSMDESSTVTTVFVDGHEYQVIVLQGCGYCLAVLDEKKLSRSYNFSLTQTRAGVLDLNIWQLPPCGHSGKDDSVCARCAEKVIFDPQTVLLSQLMSGREMWRGNWGEVRAATWCPSNAEGAFTLSRPLRFVAYKRIFNVIWKLKDVLDPNMPKYVHFWCKNSSSPVLHERGVTDPFSVTDSHGLRGWFQTRWDAHHFRDNQMQEAEIMLYLGGLPSRLKDSVQSNFLLLDAFGVDENNLYMLSELLPGASMDRLLNRLEQRRVNESTAKRIMERSCELVLCLHELSIAHRDLKLENIAFRIHPAHLANDALRARVSPLSVCGIQESDLEKLLVVLIDFGQAVWEPPNAAASISPRAVASSPPSPTDSSLALFEKDKREDLRCLGRMMYLLLMGERPPQNLDECDFAAVRQVLSPEGVDFLKTLLGPGEYTALQAVAENKWF